jgi:lysozyme
MKLSAHGLKLLAEWEGSIHHVYRDQAGLPTIGVGHLLTPGERASNSVMIKGVKVSLASPITEQQEMDLLAQDVEPAEAVVNARVKNNIHQYQFDALVIFAFNIGIGGFASSSALRLVNQGEMGLVPEAMMLWNKITDPKTKKHVVCEGLVERRRNEGRLWRGEI